MSIQKHLNQDFDLYAFFAGFAVLMPIFFTLSDGIYRTNKLLVDSRGDVFSLPLPISIILSSALILVGWRQYKKIQTGTWLITTSVAVFAISMICTLVEAIPPYRKMLMSIQLVIPMVGMILGLLMRGREKYIGLGFLVVLTIILPAQVFLGTSNHNFSAWRGSLADNLYFFTIYSHIQYVPVVMITAYIFTVTMIWPKCRKILSCLLIVVVLYALRSYSFLAIGLLLVIILSLAFVLARRHRDLIFYTRKNKFFSVSFVAIIVGFAVFNNPSTNLGSFYDSLSRVESKFAPIFSLELPKNITQRLDDWRLFSGKAIETKKSFLVGAPEPMPRHIRTSAHNHYLDVLYTFGILGLLPICVLIIWTAVLIFKRRKTIEASTWIIVFLVSFLVLIDANLKATLRQPYSGIFTYFLWGVLLTRLGRGPRPLDFRLHDS